MNDKVSIKFTAKQTPYNAGEIAGFSADRAAQLVKAKVAVYVNPVKSKVKSMLANAQKSAQEKADKKAATAKKNKMVGSAPHNKAK